MASFWWNVAACFSLPSPARCCRTDGRRRHPRRASDKLEPGLRRDGSKPWKLVVRGGPGRIAMKVPRRLRFECTVTDAGRWRAIVECLARTRYLSLQKVTSRCKKPTRGRVLVQVTSRRETSCGWLYDTFVHAYSWTTTRDHERISKRDMLSVSPFSHRPQ